MKCKNRRFPRRTELVYCDYRQKSSIDCSAAGKDDPMTEYGIQMYSFRDIAEHDLGAAPFHWRLDRRTGAKYNRF